MEKKMKKLYYNGVFHAMTGEDDAFYAMEVEKERIARIYPTAADLPEEKRKRGVDLEGQHVYPCLIDGHTHMLLTISVMAMGFTACDITPAGIEPHTIAGVGERIGAYAAKQKKNAVIAINNYIVTAMDEGRLPSREELDSWGGGRAVVVYNIDGHSTALSSKMLRMIGIDPTGHSGVLQGEDNERAQGRIIDVVGSSIGLSTLARGIANFHNYCADFGINIVGALEGNGDSRKDSTTRLIVRLARHFDMKVRLYLQYTDFDRVAGYGSLMRHLRVGGCGDWEMDGSVGSHSAAFYQPFADTGESKPCYYSQEFVDKTAEKFDAAGYQIASHAIGEAGIDRLVEALEKLPRHVQKPYHRIEHCEFIREETLEKLRHGDYAVMMQPGYAWIDKRYLHSYEQVLPKEIRDRMKLRSFYDAGICLCGSSDSPVQDMDPYLQMLGMTEFYNEPESLTPYEAMVTYTRNAARALLEGEDYGTLEVGKVADFFTAGENFFTLPAQDVVSFRPTRTYYGGCAYQKKRGTLGELVRMLLRKPRLL